jgi:hypothetical protein
MKVFVKFLAVVTVLAVLFAGYVVWASDATVSYEGYQVESALDRSDAFNGVVSAARSGDDSVVIYDISNIGSTEQYEFVTYTLKIANRDILPLEWIDIQLNNQSGDVLMVKPTISDVPALNQALVSFSLLVDRNVISSYQCTATLTYYIYGHLKTVELTLQ